MEERVEVVVVEGVGSAELLILEMRKRREPTVVLVVVRY